MFQMMKRKQSRSTYVYLFYILKVLAIQSSRQRINTVTLVDAFTPSRTVTTNAVPLHRNINNNVKSSDNTQPRMSTSIRYPLHLSSAVIDEVEDLEEEKRLRRKTLQNKKVNLPNVQVPIQINQQPIIASSTSKKKMHSIKNNKASNSNVQNNKSSGNQKRTVRMKKRKLGKKATSTSSIRVSNLLSREEEIEATTSIRDLKSVIRIRDDLAVSKTINNPGSTPSYLPNPMYKDQSAELPFKIQPTEQEWAQACNISIVQLRRILAKGRNARKLLVDGNVGLVTQIAKKYSNALRKSTNGFDNIGCILTLGDLIQEGNLGLMEAAERFDSDRGFRFATYAVHWVRSRILRCIADNSRVIRLPAHVHTTLRTIRKAKSEMEQEFGREPSMPELAHHLQMPISKLRLYTDSSLPVLSLEVPLNNGRSSKSGSAEQDKRTLMDKIASDSPTPQEDAEFESLRRDIGTAIDSLGSDLERDVLLNRFGLEDGNPRTLEETAHRVGISRDRVRRLEARALNKLRHPERNYILKEYVDNPCDRDGGDTKDDMSNHSVNNNGNRVTHFGDDAMNQFTPEMIWSF